MSFLAIGDSGFGGRVRQNRGSFVLVVRAGFAGCGTSCFQIVLVTSIRAGDPMSAVVAVFAVVEPVKLWIVHAYAPRVISAAAVAPLIVRSLLCPNEPQSLQKHR